jgi:uncharacterized protein (DUF2062 family)
MPGTGPIASLVVASILKVNRASALLGSLLTNTWLSIPVFFLSVKTGSFIFGISVDDVTGGWAALQKNFSWGKLFEFSTSQALGPVAVGYALVSLAIGVLAAGFAFIVLKLIKREPRPC